MTARTTRRTFTLGAVAATAGALTLALIPAATATAGETTPVFSYIDVSQGVSTNPVRQLAVDDVLGSTTPDPAASNLTSSGVQTYSYDVSPDGQTMVLAARTGSPATNAYNATFGIVVVHDDGVTRNSKVVAQFWNANPVLSNNGATVWWMAGATLWSADAATGAPTSHGTAFGPKGTAASPTESLARLAVSADGTAAAVMYKGIGTNTTDRVLVAPVATGKTTEAYAEVSYAKQVAPTATIRPSNASFVFAKDNTTLVYGEYDEATPADVKGVSVTIPTTPHATASTLQPNLDNFYDLRLAADGITWWMWKDDTAVTPNTSTAYSVDDTGLFTVAPVAQASDRGNGSTTFRYTPSTVAPPNLRLDSTNRPAVHVTFTFSPTTVAYGARSAYQTIGLYGGVPGTAFNAATAAEVDSGYLWASTTGVGGPWTKIASTNGASVFPIGTKWYNGRTAGLTRNTWFKWTSAASTGDPFTQAFSSPVRKVTVTPTVKVAVTKYANGTRRIAGTATRKYGTAELWRYYSGAWHKLQSVAMNSVGGYNFGTRTRPRGTYKVVTLADASWGAGYVKFSF